MPAKSKPPKRGPKGSWKDRATPRGWIWREGRPRWHPSPTLRAQGWKGLDLKDPAGGWSGRGASIDQAETIVACVAGWRLGQAVDPAFAAIAPPGAAAGGAPPKPDRLAIGVLVDAYQESAEFKGLAEGTQRDYRGKLKRMVDGLAGKLHLPAKGDAPGLALYAAAVAKARAWRVHVLAPVETDEGLVDPFHKLYWKLHAEVGLHQASGVLAVASAWLSWCRLRQSRTIHNWAAEISRETPPGRLRPLTWEEVKALVAAADRMALTGRPGLEAVADSIVLGVDLSWSQVDRLALTWDRLRQGRACTARVKTGRVGGTPLTDLGRARVARIRLRHRRMDAHPTHVIWNTATGAPWNSHTYRHAFADVRAEAAKTCPSVAGVTDADLRDTAFSWGRAAGLVDDETASRTLQSRKHIADLGDKHYGEIGPEIADRGRDKMNAYLKARGMSL